jgi:hypothetical protein
MTNQVSVHLDMEAPAHTVWELVSDITRMGEWSPESTGGVWQKGATGPTVGARFKGKNRRGARSWSTACEVTECEPGTTFAFRVTAVGLKVATWRYDIEPTPTGCRVTETWIDERGALAKALGKPVSGVADRADHNRSGMDETLRRLSQAAGSSTG